jgi:hypothetical protein
MVDLGVKLGQNVAREVLMVYAAKCGSSDVLKLIHEAGCMLSSSVCDAAAKSGDPDTLRYALDHTGPNSWDAAMDSVMASGNLDCVRVMYDKGYQLYRSAKPLLHPAVIAVKHGELEILRFVVNCSGPPRAELLSRRTAVKGGVEMLKYVRELGCVFDTETTEAAALRGDLEALRYAHTCGAPWDVRTLAAAVRGDSLACLEYAHTHGCPQEDVEGGPSHRVQARSLPVLRYVCEHMCPPWAGRKMENTARGLAGQLESGKPLQSVRVESRVDWQWALYLGRKMGPALPEALAEARAVRMERAAALAGVFWRAGAETRLRHREAAVGEENNEIPHADAERMATWEAMAGVPKELRERIAAEAHLLVL